MNKFKYLLMALMAVFIYSCYEDFDDPPAPSTFNNVGPTVTSDIDTSYVLYKMNESVAFDTITWDAAVMYEGEGLVTHYAVQIDEQGNNFASYIEFESSTTTSTQIVITVGDLNAILLGNGYDPAATYNMELRVKAYVHDDLETVYSDVASFKLTTYLDIPTPEELYLFGDATTVGWGADTSLAMYASDSKFVKFTYLENNKKFRFLKAQNTDDNTYNSNSLVNLPDNVEEADDDDNNFLFTGTSGWYKIEADYTTSTLVVETHENNGYTYVYDYDKLYLVGSMSGWDAQANPPQFEMTKVSEGLFSYVIDLADGAEFKFVLGNGEWSPNWANIGEPGNSGILGPEGMNGNIQFDGGGESYLILVNIKEGTYSFTRTSAPPIYMCGDALGGWDWSAGVEMRSTGSNVYQTIAYFTNGGAFRFFAQADWSPTSYNYPYFSSGTVDALLEDALDGDNNFRFIGTTGYYEITCDLGNYTVTMTQVDEPVMYMTGGALGGWDWTTNYVQMTWKSNGIFEATTEFINNETFRFFAQADWSPTSYNYPYFADGEVDALFEDALDGDNNFRFIGTTGDYTIELNLLDKIVTMTAK